MSGSNDLKMMHGSLTSSAVSKLAPVIGLILLCGCARHYILKLSNGYEIESAGKPKLVGGSFRYRDAKGHDHLIPESRVLEMEPASMATEDQKTFKPPRQHAPRHWYLLWLASAKETAAEGAAV
jgi:hypothetical protein